MRNMKNAWWNYEACQAIGKKKCKKENNCCEKWRWKILCKAYNIMTKHIAANNIVKGIIFLYWRPKCAVIKNLKVYIFKVAMRELKGMVYFMGVLLLCQSVELNQKL